MRAEIAKYFPYGSFRPYQDEFCLKAYDALSARRHVILEGVSGLGKTAAILASALPITKERKLSILYTSRTHRQCDRVMEELQRISQKIKVTGLSFRGRRDMCVNKLVLSSAEDARSAMELCNHLTKMHRCSFYENVEMNPRTLHRLLQRLSSGVYTSSEIKEECMKYELCPYEVAKRVLGEVDVVALSYYYVLEPSIRSTFIRHFSRGLRGSVLVLDESHNLPEISREIASERLTSQTVRLAELEAHRGRQRSAEKACVKLAEVLREMADEISEEEALVQPKKLLSALKRRLGAQELTTIALKLIGIGDENTRKRLSEGKNPRSYVQRVGVFLEKLIETANKETFALILSFRDRESRQNPMLEIVALDSRDTTNDVLLSAYATISTSGTLEPLESYRDLMGIPTDAVMESFPAPYEPDQIMCVAVLGTTTKLSARHPAMYEKLARRIATIAGSVPQNIGVFAASYDVLEGIKGAELEGLVGKPIYWERSGSTSGENDDLLMHFKRQAGRGGGILMAVAGGRSSEGADFPGEEMRASVVVGVPYPRPTVTVRAEIEYMERMFPGKGKLYGYVLPAIRRAAQSAGRAVRSLTDHSAILFLDSRFATAYCMSFLPKWIRENLDVVADDDHLLAQRLEAFFETNSDK
jgi:DNA excision repair protein ERCC-2